MLDYADSTFWQPIFDVPAGDTAAILFINNNGIIYPGRRDDPIFPAARTNDGTWYLNDLLHASVLACLDRATICTPNGTKCHILDYWATRNFTDYSDDFLILSMLYFSV